MKKKLLIPVCIVTVFFAFHACTLPSAIDIRITPDVNIPVNGGLSNIITDNIRDALGNADIDGLRILQYLGRDVQTFLIQYDVMQFDLGFFGDLNSMFDALDFGSLDLNLRNEIEIGNFRDITSGVPPINIEWPIDEIIEDIKKGFSDAMNTGNSDPIPILIGHGRDDFGGNYEDVILADFDNISIEIFDTVTFKKGSIFLVLTISDRASGVPPEGGTIDEADFSLYDMMLIDGETRIPGYSEETSSRDILFDDSGDKVRVSFDLEGRTLSNNFSFSIGGMRNDKPHSSEIPQMVNLNLEGIEISNDLEIRGVEGFYIEEKTITFTPPPIELAFPAGGFIHAEIGTGTLSFEFDNDGATTFNIGGEDLIEVIDLKLKILQQPSLQDPDNAGWPMGGEWPTIPDVGIPGLSAMTGSNGNPGEAWSFFKGNDNLNGKHINTNKIEFIDNSEAVISAGTLSFMLSDDDLAAGQITFSMRPEMNLDVFDFIHVDAGGFIDLPKIDPILLDELTDYLIWIDFDRVGVEIDFGEIVLGDDDLQIMLSIPGLVNDAGEWSDPVNTNDTIEFINANQRLTIKNDNGVIENDKLEVIFEIKFGGNILDENTRLLRLENFNSDSSSLVFEITDVRFVGLDYWTELKADLSSLDLPEEGGSFPEAGQPGIDLSVLRDYLDGFIFEGINAYLYINGPEGFFRAFSGVDIGIEARNGNAHLSTLIDTSDYTSIPSRSEPLNLDPQNTGEFRGSLPGTDGVDRIKIDGFNTILNSKPANLFFDYTYSVGDSEGAIIITRDALGIGSAETLNLSIVIELPLDLKAGTQGASFIIPSVFGDDDIFGRESGGGLNIDFIKSLTLNIELSAAIFNGGTFFMRRAGETPQNALLHFELNDRIMNIDITGDMLEGINSTSPYVVEEMGIFISPGGGLRIPSNLELINIEFIADIQYILSF